MTNQETDQQAPDAGALQVAGSVQASPNGKHWGVVHLTMGPMTAALTLPDGVLTELADKLPAILNDLARQVRLQNGGLAVAPANALQTIGKVKP